MSEAVLCAHANEVPVQCSCEAGCYCRTEGSCRDASLKAHVAATTDWIIEYLRADLLGTPPPPTGRFRVRDPKLDALVSDIVKPMRKLSDENQRLRDENTALKSTDQGKLVEILEQAKAIIGEARQQAKEIGQRSIDFEKKFEVMISNARQIDLVLHQIALWLACEGGSSVIADQVRAAMYGELLPDESPSPCGCFVMCRYYYPRSGENYPYPFLEDEMRVFVFERGAEPLPEGAESASYDLGSCIIECQKCGSVYDYLELLSWWTGKPYHLGYGKAP